MAGRLFFGFELGNQWVQSGAHGSSVRLRGDKANEQGSATGPPRQAIHQVFRALSRGSPQPAQPSQVGNVDGRCGFLLHSGNDAFIFDHDADFEFVAIPKGRGFGCALRQLDDSYSTSCMTAQGKQAFLLLDMPCLHLR